jgi:hypothetical protein
MREPPLGRPGGARTHTKRILRTQAGGDCGLYLTLWGPGREAGPPSLLSPVNLRSGC